VFQALALGKTLTAVREASFEGRLLRQSAVETRRRIWKALYWRFFSWDPPTWVLADLEAAARDESTTQRFVGLCYLHSARRDRLIFDFATTVMFDRWRETATEVNRQDVLDFLARYESTRDWRESTRKKLAGNVLTVLRDFGLLTGVQRKFIQRPVVAPEVALHLSRLLDAEGLRGRALIEAPDWRLFLWGVHDTSQALAQLAQQGALRFERSGRTVVLEVPKHPRGKGG